MDIQNINIPLELLEQLIDDWQFWVFTRNISVLKLYPTPNFEKSIDIIDCGNKIKSTTNVDRFYHTLEFIALKNRIVKDKLMELLDGALNEL